MKTGWPPWSGPWPTGCGCRPSTPPACGSCVGTAKVLGYPSSFTIYDEADALRLTSYVLRDPTSIPSASRPGACTAPISAAKSELLDGRRLRRGRRRSIYERRVADVYQEYQARLKAAGAMDFDDLLTETVRLFEEHPDVLDHYAARFKHVLVDEYQDTNRAQNDLVVALAREHRNICVVGDSDQCLPPATLGQHARRRSRPSSRWPRATRCSARASGPTRSPAGSPT